MLVPNLGANEKSTRRSSQEVAQSFSFGENYDFLFVESIPIDVSLAIRNGR